MDPVHNQTSDTYYATLSEAIAASQSGDVLVLAPGSYAEDFPDITHSLTIRCDDGMASLTRATPLTVDGRAILNVPGNLGVDLTLVGLEISGAARPGPDPNGAGVLHEFGNGNLTIERCYFHDNQNGLLVGGENEFTPEGGSHIVVRDSEFSTNGAPPGSAYAAGGKCHNIYVNGASSLLIEDSYIHSVFSQGHQIKSRAAVNIIVNNRIEDLPQLGRTGYGSSYSIDLPNGGVAEIRDNIIEKGPFSVSKYVIHYVGEGQRYAENSLLVEGNQFINDRPDGATILLNQLDAAAIVGIPISIVGNTYDGPHPYAFAGDMFVGGASDDLLSGGPGADSLVGGLGNDTYLVDDAGDLVAEAIGEGADTILTTLSAYVLGSNVEGLAYVGEDDFAGTGNSLANILQGGAGGDTLDGGTGADTMRGGGGNDLYYVNDIGDLVIELDGEGLDGIVTGLATVLADWVENLTLTGGSGLAGTGNALDNLLQGNGGANSLSGGAGNDTLSGAAGNDVLDGGAGADSLSGGLGNDIYVVDDAGDMVAEAPASGTEEVRASLGAYALTADVENLTFIGTGSFAGTGNALANRILGGVSDDSLAGEGGADSLSALGGADTLDGGTGADTMAGGTGNDTYVVESASDKVTEGTGGGIDTVRTTLGVYTAPSQVERLVFIGTGNFAGTGSSLANAITGGEGADTLNGGSGADTLTGGNGNDTYVLDNALDRIVETADGGTDTVRTTLRSYAIAAELEHLVFTGTMSFAGTGNAGANRITGAGAADTLDGGTGADTLTGGAGNDIYVLDDAGDVVVDSAGNDTIQTRLAAFDLAGYAAVENLAFIGTGGFFGLGNGLANRLTGGAQDDRLEGGASNDTLSGGAGADTLVGGEGADSMAGGLGDDVFLVTETGDLVLEAVGAGTDAVRTTLAAYTIGSNVEALVFTGAGDFAGTGNSLDNALTGGDGADTLNGGSGADTLDGGLGDDTHVVDSLLDLVVEQQGGGIDTVRTNLASLTLGDALEALVYTSANSFRGTGNDGANAITSGNGADTLDGGAGADTLTGGAGNDLYLVDDAGDAVIDSDGSTDTVQTTLTACSLAEGVERLVFAGVGDFAGTGNALANRITGGDGADTLDGGAGADTLIGGGGADLFRFVAGEADGDVVSDFAGDSLLFIGFGTAAEGAFVTKIATSTFLVSSGDGLTTASIRLSGVAALDPADYAFA